MSKYERMLKIFVISIFCLSALLIIYSFFAPGTVKTGRTANHVHVYTAYTTNTYILPYSGPPALPHVISAF